MTAYHGGKQRIGKEIATVIADMTQDVTIKGYCEPFCGMLGVYQISSTIKFQIERRKSYLQLEPSQ